MKEDLHEPRFDLIAGFYDLDYEGLDHDVDLYARLAADAPGPVVEMGCGTGRVLVPLAARGHDVTGVDISQAMLDVAKGKLQPDFAGNCHFVQADMREFHRPLSFGLGFFAMDTFRHLVQPQDQTKALIALYESLLPGGLAVLDLTNPDTMGLESMHGELILDWVIEDPESLGSLTKLVSCVVDPATQTQHITFLFDEADADGIVKRTPFLFQMHYFYPREMELLLERVGFVVEEIWGTHEQHDFDAHSPRMIFAARKPKQGAA
jgi:SAM-dependent methyltransferase